MLIFRNWIVLFFLVFLTVPVVSSLTIPSGIPDPYFIIEHYQPDKTWNGTTLFADYHIKGRVRIVEVNMLGEMVWQYMLPDDLQQYTGWGFDVELLPNNNVLFLLPRNGVYEINRDGTVVWSYKDTKVSHDADRLPNGNTLINFGGNDTKEDAQVKEVNPSGQVVWSWHAKDVFDIEPYASIQKEGWTHANAVERLPNGNTLVDLRNFNITVEVNPEGKIVWQYDWTKLGANPHEPTLLPNGNLLISLSPHPWQEVEIDRITGKVVWQYTWIPDRMGQGGLRDADRLPNGNTLVNAGNKIVEITPDKEVVWQLRVQGLRGEIMTLGRQLYKSERIGYMDPTFSITSPQSGGCSSKEIEIAIQYSDVDLDSIWYRISDRTNNTWVTDNVTYVRNKWKNAITFEGKEIGQNKVTLEQGDYTLHVWASSNGWGDENLYTPKKIITVEKIVNFYVASDCELSNITPQSSSAQPLPTRSPLSVLVTIVGIVTMYFIIKNKKTT
jgi:hypothetical protein